MAVPRRRSLAFIGKLVYKINPSAIEIEAALIYPRISR
jgi:hypothetical protein